MRTVLKEARKCVLNVFKTKLDVSAHNLICLHFLATALTDVVQLRCEF
jgi:hypothetical protein